MHVREDLWKRDEFLRWQCGVLPRPKDIYLSTSSRRALYPTLLYSAMLVPFLYRSCLQVCEKR